MLRNRHILSQNIDECCDIDIFLAKTLIIMSKSTYSWPKHYLLLRNRYILVQNIDYYCEIDIFLAKTMIIIAKSKYSWPKHWSLSIFGGTVKKIVRRWRRGNCWVLGGVGGREGGAIFLTVFKHYGIRARSAGLW